MATTTGPPVSMTTSPVARGHFSRPSKSQSYDPLAPLRSNNNIPPPNPHFVFPMRPESPPAAAVTPSQRRPRSAMGMETMGSSFHRASKGQNELPAFSFNPGATLLTPEKNSFLSPPESPMAPQSLTSPPSPRSSPVKPGYRHRRGGSEFVGGSIRGGDSITVLGISPTKSESGFEVPSDIRLPQGPPAGRRGHAHRRSAAISSHDIASIMVPAQTKDHGHSAPVSPATMERPAVQSLQAVFAPPPEDRDITPVATPVAEPAALESGARSRVGFADV